MAAPNGSNPVPITASASLAHLAWLQTALSSPTSTPMVNADGSARKLFLAPSRALIEIAGISWSPDGRWLAYSEATGSVTTSQTPYHLFVKPLDGGAAVQLSSGVDNQLSPAWSPDGTEIAYENAVPTFTSSSIQIVGADGTGVRTVLTLDTGIGGLFSWSPNGISITFGQKQTVHVVRSDGAGDHVIYRCPSVCEIGATTYSPDPSL